MCSFDVIGSAPWDSWRVPPSDSSTGPAAVGPAWAGLLDDAAVFPPGNATLPDAVAAYLARQQEWYDALVGSFVVKDTDLSSVPAGIDVSIIVTGGAGSVAGPLRLAQRRGHRVAGVEIALRDLDDLPSNARRVVAALDVARNEGLLSSDSSGSADATDTGESTYSAGEPPAYVEIPGGASPRGWQSAADEVAAAGLRLKFRTGGLEPALVPSPAALGSWIDGALDRETPFKCTAGLHHAIRREDSEGHWHHGFLNVMVATLAAWDGADSRTVELLLAETGTAVAADAGTLADDLPRARRWFTSFGTCSIAEPLDDLLALSLLKRPI